VIASKARRLVTPSAALIARASASTSASRQTGVFQLSTSAQFAIPDRVKRRFSSTSAG
jgi:hypothetical protein